MYEEITEGEARLYVPKEKKVSKKLPVFYNPVMKLNRDITIGVLNSVGLDNMQIGLPLAGSGVRGVRLLLELKKGKAASIELNDMNPEAVELIKKNLKLNHLKAGVHQKEANEFLLQSGGFDYIDIDPFGTPNPFLDAAIKRLSRCGVLAVTATDTAGLCGTYKNVCIRNYWATPSRSEVMHESALRILIRKVQLIGAQYERALTPVYSYAKDHYIRVFFKSKKSKRKADELIKQHGIVLLSDGEAGPMWTGKLFDPGIADEVARTNRFEENIKFLNIISDESKLNTLFFYDVHSVKKREKIDNSPRKKKLVEAIIEKGYKASETHFCRTAIKTDMPYNEFLQLIKEF
ncbi:MAG: tRNA (guanine(26)-N(2))-dimethyltransferase [Candidatus Nanoarchaeia archaeon]